MHAIITSGASAPGTTAPDEATKSKARGAAGFASQTARDQEHSDSAATCGEGEPPGQAEDKEFHRVRAELARRSMYRVYGAGYLISRWGHCREVADLTDAKRFLAQIGGTPSA